MRKIAVLLISFILLSPAAFTQELNGIWLSDDGPSKNLVVKDKKSGATFLDFDKNQLGNIATFNTSSLNLNRKKTKIKASGVKGKLKVQSLHDGLLILKGSKGATYTFKKLDLSPKINSSINELSDFLINQQCDLIQGIEGQFTSERFFKDKASKNYHKKNQYINFSGRDNGYWYFKKLRGNAFFVLTTGQNNSENIFQVLKLNVNGFKLLQLQDDGNIKNLNSLKTCL
jgi:hypothetical protein